MRHVVGRIFARFPQTPAGPFVWLRWCGSPAQRPAVRGRWLVWQVPYLPLLEHLGLANLTTVAGSGPAGSRVNWAWDELVLACDLVARNGWKSLAKNDLRVAALSAFLR
jgi:hypothetical protein